MPLPRISGEFTLGGDPELRFTQSGKAVASFSAIASKSKNVGTRENPDWQDDKEIWVRVTVWDKIAENVAESLEKGSRVVIIGEIFTEKYTDRDGNERTSLNVNAFEIGPSIRFATAKITKAERSNTASPSGAADPWASSSNSDEIPF